MRENIIVKTRAAEVLPFLSAVQRQADLHKDALGFIAQSAYEDAVAAGKLWVAVTFADGVETCVGHLFFGGVFPTVRIFQLFVLDTFQRQGVASSLISRLVKEFEALGYLRVVARVAEDLDANSFWEHTGFQVVTSRLGGKTRNRQILLRELKLNTPQLFDILNASASPTSDDLRLEERLHCRSPAYAFDVNVVLDVLKDRPRQHDVQLIISAGLENRIRILVAQECVTELQRASFASSEDPILRLVAGLPLFSRPPRSEEQALSFALGPVVFPERTRKGQLRERDESDLRHIATAIYHKAAGFITSDRRILKCREILYRRYRLDVIGVEEFAEVLNPAQWDEPEHVVSQSSLEELRVAELGEEDTRKARDFLAGIGVEDSLANEVLAIGHSGAPRRRLVVTARTRVVAYASWNAPEKVPSRIEALVYADETHPAVQSALDYCLSLLLKDASNCGSSLVTLCSQASTSLLGLAHSFGFRPAVSGGVANEAVLQKVCLGRVVSLSQWGDVREQIIRMSNVALPIVPPPYDGEATLIGVTNPQGVELKLPLSHLEDLLGPALLVLAGRPGAIIPIRPIYAGQLLGTSSQKGLFPKYEACLLPVRTYFSRSTSLLSFPSGTLLLFYESGKAQGSQSLVACGRLLDTALTLPSAVASSTKRRGVLEDPSIRRMGRGGKIVTCTFDMVMRFANPVSLERLRALRCDDGTSFVTARRITHDQLTILLLEGKPYV
jgi:GNAT superfamily N-acetyltransferase